MKIAFYTLGCKVNQYETQAMKEMFQSRGYEICEENGFADIYVVNTCTVTGLADRKSRQFVRRMKKVNPACITAVVGCYAQASPQEAADIAGVDLVAGTEEKSRLVDLVEALLEQRKSQPRPAVPASYVKEYSLLSEYEETGIITSMESRTRAYIKVQEGCQQFCSYCIIPYARGKSRSRSPHEIRKEAQSLLKQGFKELVLTGINTALYGMEPGFEAKYPPGKGEEAIQGIERVVKLLSDLPGEFRLRLGSLEPTVVNADYVKRLLAYDKLCPHLHLSLQSGSDRVLSRMNRHYDREGYLEIVNVLRQRDPLYGISTDLIAGFPGEGETDFEDSLDLVRRVSFVKTHVFPYSKRKGTKAASMEDQVPGDVKKRRSARLAEEGNAAALAFFKRNRGAVRQVLFEEYLEEEDLVLGYADNYIRVYVDAGPEDAPTLTGAFRQVVLESAFRDGMRGSLT